MNWRGTWVVETEYDLNDVVLIGMSQDDPSITPPEKCSYDMGIAFPKNTDPKNAENQGIVGEILKSRQRSNRGLQMPERSECEPLGLTLRDFEAEALAVLHCVGDISVVGVAWQYLFRIWLPASGYQPANAPGFEVFVRTPEEIGWETFDLLGCLPIVRL